MFFIVVPALHAGTEKEPELQERKYSDNEKVVTWLQLQSCDADVLPGK